MSKDTKARSAMKLALEALEDAHHTVEHKQDAIGRIKAITALRKALAEQPAQQDSTCSNALRAQGKAYPRTCKKCGLGPCVGLAQQALDKKAENARELGLDYEPSAGTQVSKVWWDGEKLMAKPIPLDQFYKEPAQQEPVAYLVNCTNCGEEKKVERGNHHPWCFCGSDSFDWGNSRDVPAQRTWVGLTDEDWTEIENMPDTFDQGVAWAQARLKRNNT